MKPELRWEERSFLMGELGEESGLPELLGGSILQNQMDFRLGEEDEIFEGYGRRKNAYPYRVYSSYSREWKEKKVKTAVLENDFVTAVFLPSLGGRLWSLLDKRTGENLLYTNDVIRFSNLAIRNAWFSGGVEWNIGIIGHTPLTTEPLYAAELSIDSGEPALRMYEYERARGVEYQMDFWLTQEDDFLNARMRIINTSKEVVPMYWWSNMAVPEYRKGRIVTDADEAYTFRNGCVYRTPVPMVDGVDISQYEGIKRQVDYFFDIPLDKPKYIANLNQDGYGLLQRSTGRLRSRKLFSWGNGGAAKRWQEFLTKDAGRYVEIQAGLGKTQYGCIPMPPHSAWEWLEQYGAIRVGKEEKKSDFQKLRKTVTGYVSALDEKKPLEALLKQTKEMALRKGKLISCGGPYGAFARELRSAFHERPLSSHLIYKEETGKEKMKNYLDFLKTGEFKMPEEGEVPGEFLWEEPVFLKLKESIRNKNQYNWFAHYQLGLYYMDREDYERASGYLETAEGLQKNPWVSHARACLFLIGKDEERARVCILEGLAQRNEDLAYVKEGFKILLLTNGEKDMLRLYKELPVALQRDGRLVFFRITALFRTGKSKEAFALFNEQEKDFLYDIREGEDSLGSLWQSIYFKLYGREEKIPEKFQFNSF